MQYCLEFENTGFKGRLIWYKEAGMSEDSICMPCVAEITRYFCRRTVLGSSAKNYESNKEYESDKSYGRKISYAACQYFDEASVRAVQHAL